MQRSHVGISNTVPSYCTEREVDAMVDEVLNDGDTQPGLGGLGRLLTGDVSELVLLHA